MKKSFTGVIVMVTLQALVLALVMGHAYRAKFGQPGDITGLAIVLTAFAEVIMLRMAVSVVRTWWRQRPR